MSSYDKLVMIELFEMRVRYMLYAGYTPEGLKAKIDKIYEEQK